MIGATGTGKTALALDVAQALAAAGRDAEIVNADAMQLYRGMDIGTAKATETERRGIPHHLFDVLEVTDEASVATYQVQARECIEAIIARGAVPILVGGSGLYVSSVLYDLRFPGTDPAIRQRLERELDEQGPGLLYRRLHEVDPASAAVIGASNGRRLVRALEVIELTGEPYDAGLPQHPQLWRDAVVVGLRLDRADLVTRLDSRVTHMWHDGLLDEVRGLLPHGLERGVTASRAIGYAQAIAQLRGELTEAQAMAQTAALTRRYARRQVSWFGRYPDVHWFDADAADLAERTVELLALPLAR